jgi:hypothetical protein
MVASDQICQMDTTSLTRSIVARELSPVEVVEAVLDRLERLDPTLHMFTTVVPDQAREEAKRLEAEIAAGREVGTLAGVPTGVKDLIYTKGIRTASGSHAYADFVPDEDDVVVERIRAAGAVVIGKTQVPEFGYSGTGQTPLAEPTRNPWNLDRTSGGSSAGSGAAVATGVGPFSLGSSPAPSSGARRSTTRPGGSSAPTTCCSPRRWPCRRSSTDCRGRQRSMAARSTPSTGCRSPSRSTSPVSRPRRSPRGSPTTACRSGCSSSDAGWTPWCCGHPRRSRPRPHGGTTGLRSWQSWTGSGVTC